MKDEQKRPASVPLENENDSCAAACGMIADLKPHISAVTSDESDGFYDPYTGNDFFTEI